MIIEIISLQYWLRRDAAIFKNLYFTVLLGLLALEIYFKFYFIFIHFRTSEVLIWFYNLVEGLSLPWRIPFFGKSILFFLIYFTGLLQDLILLF